MPFALIIIGLLLIISGARGTYSDLKTLLVEDFTGPGNFFYWIVAVGVAGCLGYVPGLERFSRAFLGLVILAMILAHRGFFKKFMEALGSVAPASAEPAATPGEEAAAGAGSSGGLPPGIAEMNRRFGAPPAWVSGAAQWITGAR